MQILTSHPGKAPQPVHLLHWVLQSLSLQPDQPHMKDPLMGTWPDQGLWRLSSPFCTQPLNPFEPAKCKFGTRTSVFRKFVGVFQLQKITQGLLQRKIFHNILCTNSHENQRFKLTWQNPSEAMWLQSRECVQAMTMCTKWADACQATQAGQAQLNPVGMFSPNSG